MSTASERPTLLDHAVANHHDYVWARLPFVVPMAIAAAHRRGDRSAHELAHLIVELQPLLLGHLDREEALVGRQAAASVTACIRDRMHADHVAVLALIDHIRSVAGTNYRARDGADPTERALYVELARLDEHVQAQIAIEEHLMACFQPAIGPAS
jgi:iron-sulfur cluster repair protein YtfE (RIC family)